MKDPIGSLTMPNTTRSPSPTGVKPASQSPGGFSEVIKGAIHKVDRLERDANGAIVDLLQGKADVHQAMIALQKADISMRTLLAVRNKVLDAYREVMRMHF